jgi:arabinan endo-1,5-alpha-L-arabinosidase
MTPAYPLCLGARRRLAVHLTGLALYAATGACAPASDAGADGAGWADTATPEAGTPLPEEPPVPREAPPPRDASASEGASVRPDAGLPDASALDDAGSRIGGNPGGNIDGAAQAPGTCAPDSAAGDRCAVARLDAAKPPTAWSLAGDLGAHDPALIAQDGMFYLWQTGPRLPAKTSSDLRAWRGAGSAFGTANPAWIAKEVPGATDLWAPDVSFFGGQYHLYYSASTFGSNASCIGHATRASLTSGSWTDRGSVLCSNHGSNDDWNAIDPNLSVDQQGEPWLVFGSFWSGIKAVALKPDGSRKDGEVHALASRNGGAIEGPFVVRRCGYYYLFVSFDRCCNGADSTYNLRVGRSRDLLGPYVDRQGKEMMQGGGTLLLEGAGRYRGPGHNAVLFRDAQAFNVYHAYDANAGGAPTLRVAELVWDGEGWPVSGGP